MKELTAQELKNTELNILIAFRDFCDSNGIKYYFTGGTLLGAVRHGGFIPWDDDIDVVMPRPDYELFLRKFPSDERYKVITYRNNKDYKFPYAKMIDSNTVLKEQIIRSVNGMGAFIDIFPLDGLGDSEEVAKSNVRKARKYLLYENYCINRFAFNKGLRSFLRNFRILYSFVTSRLYFNAIEKLSAKYSFDDSLYVGCIFGYNNEREVLERSIFENSIEMEFEKERFKVPIGYKAYLTSFYDDYMKLPPEEKRVTHHSVKVYWKE